MFYYNFIEAKFLYHKIHLFQAYSSVYRFAFSEHFVNGIVHTVCVFCFVSFSIFLRLIHVAYIDIFIPLYGNTPFDLSIATLNVPASDLSIYLQETNKTVFHGGCDT